MPVSVLSPWSSLAQHHRPRIAHSLRAGALAVLALLSVSGCSSVSSTLSDTLGVGESKDMACPQVAIMRDAGQVTLFRPGNGRDLTDVTSQAQIADFSGGCDYDRSGVTVNLLVALMAERGPAAQSDEASYRYFVAIVRPDRSVAAKAEFEVPVRFTKGTTRAEGKDELRQHIPLPKGTDARHWQVLLGFQLTSEQLEFNRRLLSRRPH